MHERIYIKFRHTNKSWQRLRSGKIHQYTSNHFTEKTQKELSEQTGLNNATISRMLNGARSGRPYKSTIDKIAKSIDDPELIQELYDATGYSSKKIRERKKIIADNGFSLDLSTVQVHEKFFLP